MRKCWQRSLCGCWHWCCAFAWERRPRPVPEADALARDITGQCLFNGRESITDLEDGNYRTFWTSHRQEGAHCLMVSAPEAVGGVLVRWRNPAPLAAQVKQDGEWVTVAQSDTAYAALYLPLPGLTEFRLVNAESAWASWRSAR